MITKSHVPFMMYTKIIKQLGISMATKAVVSFSGKGLYACVASRLAIMMYNDFYNDDRIIVRGFTKHTKMC